MLNELLFELELTYFDNEGEGEGDAVSKAEAAAAAAEKAVKDANAGDSEAKFTQEQVNEMMGKRTKALNEKLTNLETTYTELLEQTTLTKTAREKLQADLKQVQQEMRTKEQQIEFEKKEAEKRYETDLGAAHEAKEYYQNLYETSTIHRAISDAAMEHEGFRAEDFIAHLGPKSKVVEEIDSNGEKTGRLVPRIEWQVTNEDTKEVTLVLKSPNEVVELMKETNPNLFKSNVAKGVGEGTAAGTQSAAGPVNQQRITTEEFMRLRKDPDARRRMGMTR